MYYDRRVPPALLDLLLPDRALGWLVPWLSEPVAAGAGAHLQTRRASGERRNGGLQLYIGRTSPLEVRGRPGGRVRLCADPFYRAMNPQLFHSDLDAHHLAGLGGSLRAHVEQAAREAHRSFLDGEAVAHAGLLRQHGPLAGPDMPFLGLDSEARVGFDCKADQQAFEAALPAMVGLPPTEAVPRKLDLVGVDREGRVLLVEVKADATGLGRAAWQVAVHVARFRALLREHPSWSVEVLADLARGKARVGLLGTAALPLFDARAPLVPVIAAPAGDGPWVAAWRRGVAPVRAACHGMLDDLRFWRLSADGRLLEDVAA